MKKMLSMLLVVFATHFAAAQEAKMINIATAEEYKSMDALEKRLADYVNSAANSLKALRINGADYSKYQASISISSNPKDKLANNIAVGESDTEPPQNAQSCLICGIGSARTCFKRIRTILANGQPLVITVIEVTGDCIQITWD